MRLLAIILFAACGSRDAETPASASSSENHEDQALAAAEAPAEAPQDPGPVPVIDLEMITSEDGALSLRLRVPGPEGVELRRAVHIERRDGDSWTRVEAPYGLRTDCEASEGECITLAAGAELLSPATGTSGQCGSAALSAGEHRFIVESCAPEGSRPHRIEGEFVVPTRP